MVELADLEAKLAEMATNMDQLQAKAAASEQEVAALKAREVQQGAGDAQAILAQLSEAITNKKAPGVMKVAPLTGVVEDGQQGQEGQDPVIVPIPGGIAIPNDCVRLLHRGRYLVPLPLLTPELIDYANTTSRCLFPLVSDNSSTAINAAKKSCEIYTLIERYLPWNQLLIALSNAGHLVAESRFGPNDQPAIVGDFYTFINGLILRNTNEGSSAILTEYALRKMEKVRNGFEMNSAWNRSVLDWDEALFVQAASSYGPSAKELALTFRSTLSASSGKTSWASIIETFVLPSDGKSKASAALGELRDIQRKVLNGEELGGRLPSIIGKNKTDHGAGRGGSGGGYRGGYGNGNNWANRNDQNFSNNYPNNNNNYNNNYNNYNNDASSSYASTASSAGPSPRYDSSAATTPKPYDRPPPPPPPPSGPASANVPPQAGQPFRNVKPSFCAACGLDGHHFTECKTSSLEIVGNRLNLKSPDHNGKKTVCRDFNIGCCERGNNCMASHSCGKCGKYGFSVRNCSH